MVLRSIASRGDYHRSYFGKIRWSSSSSSSCSSSHAAVDFNESSASSSNAITSTPSAKSTIRIPSPTWSLRLEQFQSNTSSSVSVSTKTNEKSIVDIHGLAKRALLDLDYLPVNELERDLNNMMQVIEKVRNWHELSKFNTTRLSDHDLYDVPRGISRHMGPSDESSEIQDGRKNSTSMVNTEEETITEKNDRIVLEQQRRRQHVWKTFLAPKSTSVGAHQYFVIATHLNSLYPSSALENTDTGVQ
jgi:hypothetical protein